jgi:hypothetical protein
LNCHRESGARKGDRDISERIRGQEIRESEIGRHAECQCGHAQSSSAEKNVRDAIMKKLMDAVERSPDRLIADAKEK